MSLIIEVKTIPQNQQRYFTLGDYVGHEKLRFVQVSDMGNSKYEFLIAIHELVEQALQIERDISEDEITKFDIQFGKEGKEGEPGDDPKSPYYKEHQFASKIEYMLCDELGLDRNAYDRYLNEYITKMGDKK